MASVPDPEPVDLSAVRSPATRGGPRARPLRLPKPYDAKELRRLHDAMRDRPELLATQVLLEETGLRVSELAAITTSEALTWPRPPWWCMGRCRRHRAMLRVIGKGNKERTVPLGKVALRAVGVLLHWHALQRSDRGIMYPRNGHPERLIPWTDRGLRYVLAEVGRKLGIHAHPHRTRHTWITQLVEANNPIELVADMAGHASTDDTRRYYLLSERRKWEAMGRRRRWLRRG